MPAREYAVDGDQGFIGLNSRDNPVNLGKNFVSKSVNFRMDRGVATVRKGSKKLTSETISNQLIYGSCSYTKTDGTELIILVMADGIYAYNPDTDSLGTKILFPSGEVITTADEVDVYQAQGVGYVYICRGFSKTTLRWDGNTTIAVPSISTHKDYPNSRHAIYFGNRHIVQTDQNTFKVSHYLSDSTWSALDMFSINDGSSDRLVGIAPWQLNEFVVFMRNSIHYASVGVGANAGNDAATEADSYVKSLATDIGCIARKSIVQAGGGIIFLSDNGVYMLNPNGAGQGSTNTPEGMRLLTIAEPLSATISDVIARINFNYVDKAVGIYWENRYYLAVPLDSSTTNNVVLVYNFINKAWESVDSYPSYSANLSYQVSRGSPFITVHSRDKTGLNLNQFVNISNISGGQFAADKYQVGSLDSTWGSFVTSGSVTTPITTANYTVTGTSYPYTINVTTPAAHGLTSTTSLDDYPYNGSGYVPSTTLYVATSPSKFTSKNYNIVITGSTTFTFQVTSGFVSGTTSGSLTYNQSYGRLDINYGFDIKNLIVAKRGNKRRMMSIDGEDGVFLLEEKDWDEYGSSIGTPFLTGPTDIGFTLGTNVENPYILPVADACTISESAFTPNQIQGQLTSRAYNLGTNREKRYSSFQSDVYAPAGGVLNIGLSTTNPDATLPSYRYGSSKDSDALVRLPVRKSGYFAQVNITTTNLRPEVRSVSVEAVIPGHMTQTRK